MRLVETASRAVAVVTAAALAGCGGSGHPATRSASVRESASASPSAGAFAGARCVPAPIHGGRPPAWTAAAWADSSPGFTVPYALASGDAAGAFFFAPRLRAGHPENPANKVLWIVRFPRNGHPLTITARPGADPSQVVRISRPADSSPGEIYPSYVDLPKPGCWRLSLAWGSHRARIDVEVYRS
jgi:hypothetical protein